MHRPAVRRDFLVVVLTLVTGVTDAIGFLGLGSVFTSVMTGNMVLLGMAAARGNGTTAIHTGVAFLGYVLGGILGGKIAGAARADGRLWPRSFTVALTVEFVAFCCFNLGWELAGGHPPGNDTLPLLGVNALALGLQSAAVLRLGVSGLSTTYLTGTLTNVIANLLRPQPFKGSGRSIMILISLIAGAAFGALVTLHAPHFVPLLQLGLLGGVLLAARAWFWKDETGGPEPAP